MTVVSPLPPRLQRANGAGEVRFARRYGVSRLTDLYQSDPVRIVFPDAPEGEPPLGVVVTTSGGLTGGDRIRLGVAVDEGAALSMTNQAAEKVYRSVGPDSVIEIDVDLRVGPDAWLDWTPYAAILFDGARLRRRTTVSVAPGGRLLACEGFVLGRIARGEAFATGSLREAWRVSVGGRLRWVDAFHLTDDLPATTGNRFCLAGAEAMATALYVSDDAPEFLEPARELLAAAGGRAGVTVVNGVLVARFLGSARQVQCDVDEFLGALRSIVGPFSGVLPRVA